MTEVRTAPETDQSPPGLQSYTVQRIIKDIASGTHKAGQRLSPAKLAALYGVSHIPVREALSALQALGYVDYRPRVGYFVTELAYDDLEDIYRWRKALEDAAHEYAIPLLTKGDLERLEALAEKMEHVLSAEDRPAFLELNREFHFIVFERAGSPHLIRFLSYLWDASARYSWARPAAPATSRISNGEHHRLLEAFGARDASLANEIMEQHRAGTLAALRKLPH